MPVVVIRPPEAEEDAGAVLLVHERGVGALVGPGLSPRPVLSSLLERGQVVAVVDCFNTGANEPPAGVGDRSASGFFTTFNRTDTAERVQDITEEGAKAEGMRYGPSTWVGYRSAFRHVWNDINLKPRPVRRKGEVVRFESFPWCMDDFLESKVAERAKLDSILVMDMQGWKHEEPRWQWKHRGQFYPLEIYPNPWAWAVEFRPLEEGFDG